MLLALVVIMALGTTCISQPMVVNRENKVHASIYVQQLIISCWQTVSTSQVSSSYVFSSLNS